MPPGSDLPLVLHVTAPKLVNQAEKISARLPRFFEGRQKISLCLTLLFSIGLCAISEAQAPEHVWPSKTYYRYKEVLGRKIFFREAGSSNQTTILLLHGYPSSSHTYRELIPLLSGRYHVIAPDHIGSGLSDKPEPDEFEYSFDNLATYVDGLLKELNVDDFVIYMQDFGAPVGFRVIMMEPKRIRAIIAQNANAYLEGIPLEKQKFFNEAQTDQSPENIKKLFDFTSEEAIRNLQYLRDVKDDTEVMSPDAWIHDGFFLSTEKERRIQVELFQDYKTNLDRYPEWQFFLRNQRIPLLITWGANDPVFTSRGAEAYLKDVPKAELHLLDAGHFAVEEKAVEIAKLITSFLGDEGRSGSIEKQ